jgi:hypothetical protein
MGRQITFTVYGEPRPKLRAKMGRGRMYNPQANKDAAQAIDYYCREQMHINGNGDFNHNIQPKPMIIDYDQVAKDAARQYTEYEIAQDLGSGRCMRSQLII